MPTFESTDIHVTLPLYINTFGQDLLKRYGYRVHKIAIDAGMSCPNRDGSKGHGGCTFCNNVSFSPNGRNPTAVAQQIEEGRQVIRKRTGANKYIAYFQAYTNTYADIDHLRELYDQALNEPDVIGLSVGTRPDCVPDEVLDLLAQYKQAGYEVWLELGLQSAFDDTLDRVNRGHYFSDYRRAITEARLRGVPVCTHLIIGLPGEDVSHVMSSHQQVLELGVDGLKLHPLHVVKGTQLANEWRQGQYQPLDFMNYVHITADLIERTPPDICFHRITGTASKDILLAPDWCNWKWRVLNAIEYELQCRNSAQGCKSITTPQTVMA